MLLILRSASPAISNGNRRPYNKLPVRKVGRQFVADRGGIERKVIFCKEFGVAYSGNQYIKSKNSFDTQSVSTMLRADYSIKKYYLQSQVLLDYYLHSAPDRLNNAFAVIAGVNF